MVNSRTTPIHLPVLADEVVRLLVTDRDGAYFDLTVGPGGHLKAIAAAVTLRARLYGLDRDPDAVRVARANLAGLPQVRDVATGSFARLKREAERVGEDAMDGILMDLGLSSLQLNAAVRGFSFQTDGPLDMRFNQQGEERSAADLLNSLNAAELTDLIRRYGEERQARRIAMAIVKARREQPIETTRQLSDVVASVVPPPHRTKALARVFQAIRIAVNSELDQLQATLPQAVAALRNGGRLAVISYHSLEDRIVKRFFQKEQRGCVCPPELPECICNARPQLRIITPKAITPTQAEKQANPRSRSARLRVAEKIDV